MSALAIVAVSVLLPLLLGYGIYRATPAMSQPFRVKLITSDSYNSRGMDVVIVKRWKLGTYGSDRLLIATIAPSDEDFDDQLAAAISEAEHRVRVMKATQRQATRIR